MIWLEVNEDELPNQDQEVQEEDLDVENWDRNVNNIL
jgi:hypothetical protein